MAIDSTEQFTIASRMQNVGTIADKS